CARRGTAAPVAWTGCLRLRSPPTTWSASELSPPRQYESSVPDSANPPRTRCRCSTVDDAREAPLRPALGPAARCAENNSAVVICFFSSLLERGAGRGYSLLPASHDEESALLAAGKQHVQLYDEMVEACSPR